MCVPHQEVTVLLGAALLEGPVLTALDTPAFHHSKIQMDTLKNDPPNRSKLLKTSKAIGKKGDSPGGHHNDKYHLLPHHAPEVTKRFWQRACGAQEVLRGCMDEGKVKDVAEQIRVRLVRFCRSP